MYENGTGGLDKSAVTAVKLFNDAFELWDSETGNKTSFARLLANMAKAKAKAAAGGAAEMAGVADPKLYASMHAKQRRLFAACGRLPRSPKARDPALPLFVEMQEDSKAAIARLTGLNMGAAS